MPSIQDKRDPHIRTDRAGVDHTGGTGGGGGGTGGGGCDVLPDCLGGGDGGGGGNSGSDSQKPPDVPRGPCQILPALCLDALANEENSPEPPAFTLGDCATTAVLVCFRSGGEGDGGSRFGSVGDHIGSAWAKLLALLGFAGAAASGEAQQAEEEGQVLYRAVSSSDAADIVATGTYRIAGASAEYGKYFYPTLEQAKALVQAGWASQVTSGVFPRAAMQAAEKLTLPGERLAYFIAKEFFPHGPVQFH